MGCMLFMVKIWNLPKNAMARNESFKDKAMQNQERTFGIG